MKIVLLEKISKCGGIGDVVDVADGFARNYLIPNKKALRATKENIAFFEEQKERIVSENLRKKEDAESRIDALKDQIFFVLRQTSDKGQLYGSVTAKDIAALVSEKFFDVKKENIIINAPIKEKGVHQILVALHPEVKTEIYVSVAPSLVEAENQLRQGADEEKSKKENSDRAAVDFEVVTEESSEGQE